MVCSSDVPRGLLPDQAARRTRQEAEGRGAESESDAAASYRRGRRLWDEIHTVHYSR